MNGDALKMKVPIVVSPARTRSRSGAGVVGSLGWGVAPDRESAGRFATHLLAWRLSGR
jgi:hypothetical protein